MLLKIDSQFVAPMKRCLVLLMLPLVSSAFADDYIDDLYYTESTAVEQSISKGDIKPTYNKKNMQKLVFIEDTPADLPADTLVFVPDTAYSK